MKSGRSTVLSLVVAAAIPAAAAAYLASAGTNSLLAPALSAQEPQKTIWDGVFTEAQALRGEQKYYDNCGHCHLDNLRGGDEGEPPLIGTAFKFRFDQEHLSDVFQVISQSMPRNKPGSLDLQTYSDILAFILYANRAPVGEKELVPDIEALKQILFTEKPVVR